MRMFASAMRALAESVLWGGFPPIALRSTLACHAEQGGRYPQRSRRTVAASQRTAAKQRAVKRERVRNRGKARR